MIAESSKDRQLESELAGLLGDLLRDLQRPDDAMTAYRRALTLNGEDVQGQINILARLVPLCAEAGHWQDTADYARQGLIVSDGQYQAQEVLWLLDLAMALLELGRDLEAIDAARDALVIARLTEPGGRLEHDTLGRLGTLLTETGDQTRRSPSSKRHSNSAPPRRRVGGRDLADPPGALRLVCRRHDRRDPALHRGAERRPPLGDRLLEAHILGSLGTLLRETGQHRRSLEYYHQALELSKLANEGREVVRYLTQMGRTYGELRQYDDASRSFNEALTLARRIDDKRGQVETHRRLATLLRSRRDREGAMAQITAAAALIAGIDDPRLASITLQELASVQEELGRWEESAASYRRMLSNAERIDDLNGKLQAHLQLGRILQYQQPNEAHQHLRQALDLAHEINDPQIIDQVSELLPTGTEIGDDRLGKLSTRQCCRKRVRTRHPVSCVPATTRQPHPPAVYCTYITGRFGPRDRGGAFPAPRVALSARHPNHAAPDHRRRGAQIGRRHDDQPGTHGAHHDGGGAGRVRHGGRPPWRELSLAGAGRGSPRGWRPGAALHHRRADRADAARRDGGQVHRRDPRRLRREHARRPDRRR